MSETSLNFTRSSLAIGLLASLLALYGLTVARSVGPADSAELAVALATWGVPHAPGYPLLCLLGNLLTHSLSFVDSTMVLNVANALVAAVACSFVAMAVTRSTGSGLAGLVAGLALGTSRIFWRQALAIEVFSLTALMAALFLYLESVFLAHQDKGEVPQWVVPGVCLVLMTGITHHATLALIAIPGVIVMAAAAFRSRAAAGKTRLSRRALTHGAFAIAVGLLPLAYIPIASHFDPQLNWGDVHDLPSLGHLLLRRDYGTWGLLDPIGVASQILLNGEQASPLGFKNLGVFWRDIPADLGWWFLPFPLIGLFHAWRRRPALFWHGALFLGLLTAFLWRLNTPILPLFHEEAERFFIIPHVGLAFFAGLGIAEVERALTRNQLVRRCLFVVLLLFAGPIAIVKQHGHVDQHDNSFTRDFGHNLLAGVPGRSLFFSSGDMFHHSLLYQQAVRRQRPDVTLILQDNMQYPWFVSQLRRRQLLSLPSDMVATGSDPGTMSLGWLDRNADAAGLPDGRPAVAVKFIDRTYEQRYKTLTLGLWSRVLPRAEPVEVRTWREAYERTVSSWEARQLDRSYPEASWEGTEQVFYDYALGALFGLRDLATIHDGVGTFEPIPALEQASRWTGRRAASLLAFRADFLRECSADASLSLTLPERHRAARLATEHAERSLGLDSSNVQALQALAGVLAGMPDLADAGRELELRRRIVELRPGDLDELVPYFRLAIAQSKVVPGGDAVMADATKVQQRFVRLLGTCYRVAHRPVFLELERQWTRPLTEALGQS